MPALLAKRLAALASIIVFSLFAAGEVLAGSGLVSTVGGATFIQGAKHFWVTSATPTFSGVTTAGAKVTGTIGTQAVSATADSAGNWSWTAAALSGDTAVSITSGATTASFTLTIGAVPASIASSSASSLAPAGSISPTILFLAGGSSLILLGSFGLAKSLRTQS
ncbi:MAG: hypothetical protein Q7S45_02915 [Candidatus Curtissbacteria bacterium]|nr:hypothetical protein [Candidatus Curtissbacteria bacterium]